MRGFLNGSNANTEFDAQSFLIESLINKISTTTLVRVMAVTNAGGVSPVGFVDIQPLVNQINGDGELYPHGTIYKCPYFRIQGGTSAIILDPQVGDIGIALFADKDISSVIANKTQANPQSPPGSRRRFSMSDGLYIGGVLNGTPTQYIQFINQRINVVAPKGVHINSEATVTGSLHVGGNVTVGSGASGSFTSTDGKTVTVQDGIITNIY
jgi:hypothetical protein